MEEAVIKRILPHNTEAEQSVLGSMFMSRDAIMVAADILTGEDFYQRQYGAIFTAMVELYGAGQPVDLVTLQNRLREKGLPPEICSVEYYGFSQEKAGEGVVKYREYFNERGWKENKVYEGIPQMLSALKEKGFKLMIATSKPEVFAVRILEHFDLAKYFDFIGGADLEETRVRKGDVIRYVMEKMKIFPSEAVMVGDRKHDAIGAKEAGIDCIGVLFGYGSREELEGVQTCYLAESVADLEDYLLKGERKMF